MQVSDCHGSRLDDVALAAFDVPDHAVALLLVEDLAEEDGLELPPVVRGVAVVEMRRGLESRVADRPQRQRGVVKVEEVGLVSG